MKEGQGTEQWCSLLPWKGCAEWGVPAWEWDGTGAGTAAASPPRVPGAEQSLHECMTEKRADTQGYVEGKGQSGGWPREGSRDVQPGCSRGHLPHGHTSPSGLEERIQSRPQGIERLL